MPVDVSHTDSKDTFLLPSYKLIYSRNIPTYFRSDIMDEDVLCTIGQEDKKLLLSDDFNCWDEGCLVGKVSSEAIKQMPKCN